MRYALAAVCPLAYTEERQILEKDGKGKQKIKSYKDTHVTVMLMAFDGKAGTMIFKRVKSVEAESNFTYMLMDQLSENLIDILH